MTAVVQGEVSSCNILSPVKVTRVQEVEQYAQEELYQGVQATPLLIPLSHCSVQLTRVSPHTPPLKLLPDSVVQTF